MFKEVFMSISKKVISMVLGISVALMCVPFMAINSFADDTTNPSNSINITAETDSSVMGSYNNK